MKPASRIKALVFRYASVAAKWIKMTRQHVLNLYTSNKAYEYTLDLADAMSFGDHMRNASTYFAGQGVVMNATSSSTSSDNWYMESRLA